MVLFGQHSWLDLSLKTILADLRNLYENYIPLQQAVTCVTRLSKRCTTLKPLSQSATEGTFSWTGTITVYLLSTVPRVTSA